jgi:hypothetical protein
MRKQVMQRLIASMMSPCGVTGLLTLKIFCPRKLLISLLSILIGSCAHNLVDTPETLTIIRTYKIKDYTVFIADYKTVNEEWSKLNLTNEPDKRPQVNGFTNFTEKEIWSIDNYSTLIHEFKHMMEGTFHKPYEKIEIASFTSKEERLYKNMGRFIACVKCHGEKGEGTGVLSQALKAPARNFTDIKTMKTISDERIFEAIKKGIPESGMPSYDIIISDEEIMGLVRFIRFLAGNPSAHFQGL